MSNTKSPRAGIWSDLRWATKADLQRVADTILMKISELAAQIQNVTTQVDAVATSLNKAQADLTAELDNLKQQLADQTLPDDAQASLDALTAKVAALGPVAEALDALAAPPAPPTGS